MHAPHPTPSVLFRPDVAEPAPDRALPSERSWRQIPAGSTRPGIVASRWCDEEAGPRRAHAAGSPDRHTVAVALRPARLRLSDAGGTVFEGTMLAGSVHVSEPGQALDAEFHSPCDFVHFHVPGLTGAVAAGSSGRNLRNLLVHDAVAAELCRTLANDADGDGRYAAGVGDTILMRLFARAPAAPRVGKLPKWRLRRVEQHLAANIAEPIKLADLASAAGLSRMHFAAQFRAATGYRPHDYLLQLRVEHAKRMLADTDTPLVQVALGTGFQTQSHFSTVFKRLAGETPGRWQRARRAA